jgi:hypothetical protein
MQWAGGMIIGRLDAVENVEVAQSRWSLVAIRSWS